MSKKLKILEQWVLFVVIFGKELKDVTGIDGHWPDGWCHGYI